jgi:hypothetical protein
MVKWREKFYCKVEELLLGGEAKRNAFEKVKLICYEWVSFLFSLLAKK